MTNPTPHKHAALIKQWADDPSQTVWRWHEGRTGWNPLCVPPNWHPEEIYAIGPKPTQPPRKMCVLAGVEFPMPETEAPRHGATYYVGCDIKPDRPFQHIWGDWESDFDPLKAGYVHLTREAAVQHGKALLAANKQAIEGAK